MSFLISPAYAQDAGGGPLGGVLGSMGGFVQILPFVLVFIVFYFLLVRPQQQRQKQLKNTLSALKRGDRVVTAGGIIGTVQRARDGASEIEVEIATGVRVMVLRETISSVLGDAVPPAANDAAPEKKSLKG